jgi:OOP family OmpA-OmpF porin
MSKRILLAAGLAGVMASAAVQAEETFMDDRFYAAPFGSYLHPGGDTKGFDGWGAGLGIGKIINEYFNVELRGFWQNYSNQIEGVGGKTDLTGGTADLQYYFWRDIFSPYAVLGVGGMNTSSRTSFGTGRQQSSFIFEAGVGATVELADNFLLRGDVRYRGNTADTMRDAFGVKSNNDVLNDLVVNLGFVIPFGDKPQAIAQAPDDCASRDTDHDGVNDCDDRCPGTMEGAKVDDQGCPIVMELRGVNFMFDSDQLTPGAMTILDGVVGQLTSFPTKRDIEVAGYASYEGKPKKNLYNLKLSQRRSESVARYLKSKGVTNKLYAKGYGVEYPVADNNSEAGRAKNRRVELRWMGD